LTSSTKTPYDLTNGRVIDPEWDDRMVPIPTQEVQERVRLPLSLRYATLAEQVAEQYNPHIYKVARDFVVNYPKYRDKGEGILLAGLPKIGKTWAAAGVLNEVLLRYSNRWDLKTFWMSSFYTLQLILDHKTFRQEDKYFYLRNRAMKADLVVVDHLLGGTGSPEAQQFLWSLYEYRAQHNLPVITTVTIMASDRKDFWKTMKRKVGTFISYRLQDLPDSRSSVNQIWNG